MIVFLSDGKFQRQLRAGSEELTCHSATLESKGLDAARIAAIPKVDIVPGADWHNPVQYSDEIFRRNLAIHRTLAL